MKISFINLVTLLQTHLNAAFTIRTTGMNNLMRFQIHIFNFTKEFEFNKISNLFIRILLGCKLYNNI